MSLTPYRVGRTADPDLSGPGASRTWYRWPWLVVGLFLAGFTTLWVLAAVGWIPSLTGDAGLPPEWPFFPFGLFLVAFLLVVILRRGWWGASGCARGYGPERPAAHEILVERFARGELTAEQVRQMRRELDGLRDERKVPD